MKTIYNDADKWVKQFHNTSDDGRYDLVISTLKAPLTESFIEELDFGCVLVEMLGNFEKEKEFDKILNLIEVCIAFQPTLYKKEHSYFDEFLINWHLFHQEKEKLAGPLDRFTENPVKGIDNMIRALKSLLFNKADAVAFLWGAQYVYDFLLSAGIIKGHAHAEFVRSICSLKARMLRIPFSILPCISLLLLLLGRFEQKPLFVELFEF